MTNALLKIKTTRHYNETENQEKLNSIYKNTKTQDRGRSCKAYKDRYKETGTWRRIQGDRYMETDTRRQCPQREADAYSAASGNVIPTKAGDRNSVYISIPVPLM